MKTMIRNPFITSGYVSADYFCDRRFELRSGFWGLLCLAASLPSVSDHCSTCVAQDIRGMMT